MRKFDAIESLRGWMAWWVVAGHCIYLTGSGKYLHPTLEWYALKGSWAVATFMIVSGFVITHLLISKPEHYTQYIVRRCFRLAPLFLIILFIAIATRDLYGTAFGNPYAEHADMHLDRLNTETKNWTSHIVLHMLMLQGAVPDTLLPYSSSAILGPAWSLSLEWQFYLIAPLLVGALSRWQRASLFILPGVLILTAVVLSGALGTWRYPSFFFLATPFFLAGITSRLLFDGRIPVPAVLVTLLSLLIYISMTRMISPQGLVLISAIWLVFLLITARESGRFAFGGALVDRFCWLVALNPVSIALGRVSFSTYLAHVPIIGIVLGSGMRVSGRSDQPFVIMLVLLSWPIILASSFALYHYVERPGMRFGRQLADRFMQRAPA